VYVVRSCSIDLPRLTLHWKKQVGAMAVKLRAALLDADAVVNVLCNTSSVDWVNNCWSSIICAGDAIRYKP
jgi:uncharacterized protein YbjQ (UPF0145 family)